MQREIIINGISVPVQTVQLPIHVVAETVRLKGHLLLLLAASNTRSTAKEKHPSYRYVRERKRQLKNTGASAAPVLIQNSLGARVL